MNECRTDNGLGRSLGIADVSGIVCRSRASICRDIQAGTFPKQVKAGKSSRWHIFGLCTFIAALRQA